MSETMTFHDQMIDQLDGGDPVVALLLFGSETIRILKRGNLIDKADQAYRQELLCMQRELMEFFTISKFLPHAFTQSYFEQRKRQLFFCASELAIFLQTVSSHGEWAGAGLEIDIGAHAVPEDVRELMNFSEYFEAGAHDPFMRSLQGPAAG